ncbi:unnamed protein product [Brassicogethes aeneus]|nr:unnamed protein product [Brassicogethes aeneus]
MDDYNNCNFNFNKYCEIKIELTSLNNGTQIWKHIQNTKQNPNRYDQDLLRRLLCLPSNPEENSINKSLKSVQSKLTQQYGHLDLRFDIKNVSCKSPVEVDMNDVYEYILYLTIISYLCFIAFASYMHYKKGKVNKYIKSFSVLHNWESALQKNTNPDFQRLKSLQGIRTIGMFLVVMCHANLSIGSTYIRNTKYLEDLFDNVFVYTIIDLDVHIVQIFFIISAWLLALQMNEMLAKNGEFNLKSVFVVLTNRLMRVWPCLAIMIALHKSKSGFVLYPGPLNDHLKMDNFNCNNNWWQTLFFVNNLVLNPNQVCNIGTWYISTDMQMYVFSVFLFYFMTKYKLGMKTLISVFFTFVVLFGGVIFFNDLDMTVSVGIEVSTVDNLINSTTLFFLYFNTVSCASTFILGLIFGTIYFKYRDTDIFQNKILLVLFWMCWIFPFSAVWISSNFNFRGGLGAIIGSLLKPLFTLGFSIFVLGLSQNRGGILKRFCELRNFEIIANFCFCTYLFHFTVVFEKLHTQTTLLNLSVLSLAEILASDLSKSFLIGFFMFFILEKPVYNLQKMFGPKCFYRSKKE